MPSMNKSSRISCGEKTPGIADDARNMFRSGVTSPLATASRAAATQSKVCDTPSSASVA